MHSYFFKLEKKKPTTKKTKRSVFLLLSLQKNSSRILIKPKRLFFMIVSSSSVLRFTSTSAFFFHFPNLCLVLIKTKPRCMARKKQPSSTRRAGRRFVSDRPVRNAIFSGSSFCSQQDWANIQLLHDYCMPQPSHPKAKRRSLNPTKIICLFFWTALQANSSPQNQGQRAFFSL